MTSFIRTFCALTTLGVAIVILVTALEIIAQLDTVIVLLSR
jgi:hypothetical protein